MKEIRPRINRKKKKRSGRNIGEFFLDSGAFGLSARFGQLGDKKGEWFLSKEFKTYVHKYAEFIAEYGYALDHFATMDVIGDPVQSLQWTEYLKKRLLKLGVERNPVPVIHFGTGAKCIYNYIDRGHDFIGLGAGIGKKTRKAYNKWLDSVFTEICPKSNDYRPIVKVHGFAVTSWKLLTRFPWWSVDSTTYNKMAGYGWLLVPQWNNGRWDFTKNYHQIGICDIASPKTLKKYEGTYSSGHFASVEDKHKPVYVSPAKADGKKHISNSRELKRIVDRWLEFIDIPFGDEHTEGVSNKFALRSTANILYFDMLQQHLERWPSQFKPPRGPSLLDLINKGDAARRFADHVEDEPRLFITGGGPDKNCVEGVLDHPQVMMSYFDMQNGPNKRFSRHAKQRKQNADC